MPSAELRLFDVQIAPVEVSSTWIVPELVTSEPGPFTWNQASITTYIY